MHKCFTVLLALLACHGVLLTHGRQITSMKYSTTNTETAEKQNPQVTLPSLNNSSTNVFSSAEEKVDEPLKVKYHVAASDDSGTNAFRPTTPGKSPGVGHRTFAGDDNDMKAQVAVCSPDVPKDYYITEESTDDFRRTSPGHSPRVGHILGNKN